MTNSYLGKVLIVDDEVELKNVLVEALTAHGYEAVGFTSGEKALAVLREQPYDVLLTDLMMPGIDGITLVRESMQIDPNLVCIMMTGQGTIQTAVAAMKVGAFDYVLKPFRLQTMLPVMTRAMNMRHLLLENVQLREAVAIHQLSETIAFTLDPQTVLSKLADAALLQSQADEVSVLLPVGDSDEFYVAAVRGEKRERLLGERVPFGQSISSWVARQHTPVILNGEVVDDRFVALWPRADISSSVSIPMLVAKKLVGVLNLNVIDKPRPFTLGQMKGLTILAGTAASALESASLHLQVQQAEKNYRSIFENAVEGIFRSTSGGKFITVNPALAQVLGYESPDEVVNSFTDIGQLYVDPSLSDEIKRSLAQGQVVRGFEFEAYRKDRRKIWLSLNIRIIHDEKGKEICREGTIKDITDRKRAEAERLIIFEIIQGSITTRNLDEFLSLIHKSIGKLLYAENCFVALYDESTSLMRYEYWVDQFDPLPLPRPPGKGFSSYVLRTNKPLLLTEELKTQIHEAGEIEKSGRSSACWLGVPLRKASRAIGVLVVQHYEDRDAYSQRDLEFLSSIGDQVALAIERKRAEEALTKSEEQYRDLVENAHDIIYSHDLMGKYTSMNQAGQQITGYTPEEALALNITQIVAPEDLPRAREMLRRKLAGEKVTAYEMEIVAKDGHRIAIEVNTRLVMQDGVPVGVQGIARDITGRKQMEKALRESEEQLRQSQKMEAIGQLAGGVAHDFNNLLTAINGYSSLALKRLGENHPIQSYLEEIQKAGDRAANLTRQLLAFGRKQLLQPLLLNLNDVVRDVHKLLKRLIGEDVQLVAKLTPDLQRIKADPGQVEQVLVNLVVNARDAMPRGGTITIETSNVELDTFYTSKHADITPGRYVMLAVSDTGTGMDHDTQERIFEPFFTTKEKGKGTGLGLSTVYGIVRQSGGNVWVYSEPGKGTTFKVYLPQSVNEVEPPVTPEPESTMRSGTETVLLVEDEDMVRDLAIQLLKEGGYNVLEASGGEEALGICKEHTAPIDLLITDVVMPKMSGKDVADQLKTIHPETKVLFMSGYTDEAIVHHGIVDPDIAFLQKPFSEKALAQKIREVLDESRNSGEGNSAHPQDSNPQSPRA
jgi:PAS domain S-box-containing protein